MDHDAIERLIEAGAIVGPGVTGEAVDEITARQYRHPALPERPVVTLVPATLGPAEDLVMDFFGFAASADPVVVGSGRRRVLGFPAWALANDPANGHHALALVKDVERLARAARSKPKLARDGYHALGDRLSRAAPQFLPSFYEQAGRTFLEVDQLTFAAGMFDRAREAELAHSLPIDEDRQREVFLEFAFSGALAAKSMTAYAKALAQRLDPVPGYELFLRMCVERVVGGLPPYAKMADDLRRLAKSAGLSIPGQDERVIAAILESPTLPAAPQMFWTAYAPALARLGKADLAVRARLLDLLPVSKEAGLDDLWFDLLAETGARRGLIEVSDDPEIARPSDGAAGWLARVLRWQDWGLYHLGRSRRLLDLVVEMAPRLRAEGTVLDLIGDHVWQADLDLLDLCCALDLAFAVPDSDRLTIRNWLEEDPSRRRDLAALVRLDWARDVLVRDLERELPKLVNGLSRDLVNAAISRTELRALLDNAPLRELIGVGLERLAEPTESGALPVLEKTINALAPLVQDVVLDVAPALAARLGSVDIGQALARSLRVGLFDELHWPALEQAVAEYGTENRFEVTESWPMLVLISPTRITVVGPDEVLLRHDVRIPPDRPLSDNRLRADYVDDQLLVTWRSVAGSFGYWSGQPDEVFTVESRWLDHYDDRPASGLPLPGGGRAGGGQPLRPGDTTFTPIEPVAGDGKRWWRQMNVWSQFDHYWQEYDPQTGEPGPRSRPPFFEPTATEEEGKLLNTPCTLAPVQPGLEPTLLGTADGLLGWRTFQVGGGHIGMSITGAVVQLSSELVARNAYARPVGLLRWPGSETARVVLMGGNGISLMAGDTVGSLLRTEGMSGGVLRKPAAEQPYARGTGLLPPFSHWHALRVRDESGSAALRAVTDAQAQTLLLAAQQVPEGQDLGPAIRRAVRGISDPQLIAGVAGLLRIAVGLLRQVQPPPGPDPTKRR